MNLGDHSQYGLSVCMVRCFADVVKARIMNQATDQFGRGLVYKGSVDCAMKTVSGEGVLGRLVDTSYRIE